ncbi:MAG TPA: phage major capsid protein [Tepidisphaeraceae bacterium]|jgi:HK97 family phage major capsid protein|nr:phage major capsid protein [Tepidisphaeraceae bacterium]
MFDIKTAREEMKKLHDEATAHVEKYSAADAQPTDEDTKAQDARFARLEKLRSDIEASEKLARFAFTKEEPKDGSKVTAKAVPVQKTPDHIAAELASKPRDSYSRDEYASGLSSWVRGDEREDYATITVSGNSAIVPQVVTSPITPIKYNCYRAAAEKLGFKPESYGNTAPAVSPVISSTSGGAIPEGTQNTQNDANPSIGNITLAAHGYQSKTYWYSNEMINAQSFDVTTSTLPALQGAREYGFASAISAALIADGSITQSVTSPTHNTVSLANLDSLIHAFNLFYDANKVIFLNMDVYNACESLLDSNGRPIFEMFTIQDESFKAYKGVPVFKHDSFQGFGTAGNILGYAVSFTGFRLRDEQEKLIKYVDSPNNVDMTGLNNVRYQGWGYVPAAVVKFVAGT